MAKRKSLNRQDQEMTLKPAKIFGLFKVTSFHRHHIEPRVQLYVPIEETFPIPLKYIDVMRSTNTELDAAQEKRIDDYWNVDGDGRLSDSWTGFTNFTLLKTTPKGYMWSGRRRPKIQTTTRPDHVWP